MKRIDFVLSNNRVKALNSVPLYIYIYKIFLRKDIFLLYCKKYIVRPITKHWLADHLKFIIFKRKDGETLAYLTSVWKHLT